jgi:hypothetical protein
MNSPRTIPYVTFSGAARRLGRTSARVDQLAKAGKLAFVLTQDGRRLLRASSVDELERQRRRGFVKQRSCAN